MSPFSGPSSYRAVRLGPLSVLLRPRIVGGIFVLAVVALLLAMGAVLQGSLNIPSQAVLEGLWSSVGVSPEQEYVLRDIRLPRVLTAIQVGAMLSMAGTAMQAVTRNGLADPGLVGVKEAASIMVLALVIFFPMVDPIWRPLAGIVGGLAIALLVVGLAGDVSRTRFVLVGIGVSWILSAGMSIFMTTADIRDVETALLWMAGSLHAATWPSLSIAVGWGGLGAGLLFATARAADVALLGDEVATGLGVRRQGLALLRFVAPVLLTAATVSCVGSLGFVGLIAPHIARFVIGGNQTALLTASALFGAIMVLAADTIGRLAFAPLQIPAGIVMSVIGVPFFLTLLWQRRDRL